MADELAYGEGLTGVPILPIAGLLDPRAVGAVECSIDGYVPLNNFEFVSAGKSNPGRKACSKHDGLFVDGGPDAIADTAFMGRGWIMLRFQMFVNHFFSNQENALTGDVLQASLDGDALQKVVVSGDDPQRVSLLFTGVRSGLHEIDYGPWATEDAVSTTNGYHRYCLRL